MQVLDCTRKVPVSLKAVKLGRRKDNCQKHENGRSSICTSSARPPTQKSTDDQPKPQNTIQGEHTPAGSTTCPGRRQTRQCPEPNSRVSNIACLHNIPDQLLPQQTIKQLDPVQKTRAHAKQIPSQRAPDLNRHCLLAQTRVAPLLQNARPVRVRLENTAIEHLGAILCRSLAAGGSQSEAWIRGMGIEIRRGSKLVAVDG